MNRDLDMSVVVCAHNPDAGRLTRTLAGLRGQTLDRKSWELLLIDNASTSDLANRYDLGWHPRGRHVREDQLGLSNARRRAIAETDTSLLVFVDDDNVLDPDYVQVAREIALRYDFLGTWGGQSIPEYEVAPRRKLLPFVSGLALRECAIDSWSNYRHWSESHPLGAGICVRRAVAERFVDKLRSDPRRLHLGRRGNVLSACEDFDLNRTACDLGLGCGVFQALKLTHLIPAGRVQESYLLRLWKGLAFSSHLIRYLDREIPAEPTDGFLRRNLKLIELLIRQRSWTRFKFARASLQGELEAVKLEVTLPSVLTEVRNDGGEQASSQNANALL